MPPLEGDNERVNGSSWRIALNMFSPSSGDTSVIFCFNSSIRFQHAYKIIQSKMEWKRSECKGDVRMVRDRNMADTGHIRPIGQRGGIMVVWMG